MTLSSTYCMPAPVPGILQVVLLDLPTDRERSLVTPVLPSRLRLREVWKWPHLCQNRDQTQTHASDGPQILSFLLQDETQG